MMSKRFAEFMTECLGVPKKTADSFIIPLNVDDDDPLLRHAKDDLIACFDLVFEDMMGRSTFDEAETASSISEIAERHEARRFKRLDDSSELYLNKFRKRLHLEEASGSSASLESIYVEPEYVYYPNSDAEINIPASLEEVIEDFICGDVSKHANMDRQARVFTMLGQPGVGKTSFLQFLISEHDKGRFCPDVKSVYCIPLRELASSGFASSERPLMFIKNALGIGSEGLSDTLLILDGLDELCLVLSAGASINSFYLSLIRDADSYRNCHVLVTSRLNYVSEVFGKADKAIVVELKEFSWNGAEEMIDKLGIAREKAIPKAIVASLRDRFESYPFLTVPLLLYTVIALEINVGDINEIGQLYDRIFAEMTKRSYGVGGEQQFSQAFDPRELARAFAADMRCRGKKYLDAHEAATVLSRISSKFPQEERTREAIEKSYGLTFFYEKANPDAFAPEFLHLSFVEFLAAEQIYLSLSQSIEQNKASEHDEGLVRWWEEMDYLFGGAGLSDQVVDFFRYKVESNEKTLPKEEVVQTMLDWLFMAFLDKGMVYSAGSEDIDNCVTKASRMFVAYWKLMKCLYPRQSILEKADEYDKSEFLLFLRIASRQTDVAFSLQCENLSFCDLRDLDLSDCDLTNADMSRSNLAYSRFLRADLSGANLLCSNLDMVDFTGADMNGTNIAFTSSKTACFDDLQFDLAKSPNKTYGLTIDENQKASGIFDEYPHSVMIPETDEIRNELMSNQKDAREFWDGL